MVLAGQCSTLWKRSL